jgi:hypothetical protein
MTTQYISSIQAAIYKLDAMKCELRKEQIIREVTMKAIDDMLEEKLEELVAAQWMEDNK